MILCFKKINLARVIVFIAAVFAVQPVICQTTFQQYITVLDSTFLSRRVTETSDGSLAVTGVLEFRRPLQQPPLYEGALAKLTPTGTPVWTLKFRPGSALLCYIDDVKPTPDGGMIALVMTKEDYGTRSHPHIVKVSSTGVVEWVKLIPGTNYFYFNGLQQISGGYLVTAQNYGVTGALVFKIDLSGNVLWMQNLNDVRLFGNRIAEDEDGNLYVPGGIAVNGSILASVAEPLLVKLNGQGELLWSKTYTDQYSGTTPHPSFLHIRRCLALSDGLLLLSNNFDSKDMVLTKTDFDGNPVVQKRFKKGGVDSYFPILNAFVKDNGEIIVSTFDTYLENRPAIFSLSNALEMQWIKSYGIDGIQLYNFGDMEKLKNGAGYIFSGPLYDKGPQQICVVKADSSGEFSGRCCPRTEEVFQGVNNAVNADEVVLEQLAIPAFVDATISHTLVTANRVILCEQSASASMIMQSDTLICPGNCLEVSMLSPEPGNTYQWEFPGAIVDTSTLINPGKVCYADQGRYNMMLYEEGCLVDSAAINVAGRPEMFPNAFSPNGDQINDLFRPLGLCPVEEFNLKIFNRWGRQIFESTEINEGWNGEINGAPAPVDVYIYQVQYFAYINGVRTLLRNEKKEVTLIR